MEIWIALLRGVNVGGKNRLPMAGLIFELERIGFSQVRTHIQSGNVVFRAPGGTPAMLGAKIGDAIHGRCAFRPHVAVLTKAELVAAVERNPFGKPEGEGLGKALHLFFLDAVPKRVDPTGLNGVKRPSEAWHVDGRIFYLCAPEGFHVSKLAAKVEKLLDVQATARNWHTVSKILELVNEYE
jgi:uncharacterized protein (DUF1697 family)